MDRLGQAAASLNFDLLRGVYAQVTGPCYETPAEIRAFRCAGVDAVGMSTAREIDAAHALGLECAAISCITNRAAGLSAGPINHKEVLAIAAGQQRRLQQLIERCLNDLANVEA